MMHVFAFKQTLTYINLYLLLNRAVVIDKNERSVQWVLWCSGYHICFTRRWSRVRTSPEPVSFLFQYSCIYYKGRLEYMYLV